MQMWNDGTKKWVYTICGQTTVHLQHETYLLISLALLTVASFQGLYKEAFGLSGDVIFCFITTLWLSRYLFSRWLCTWDISTNSSPTVRGVLTHWITSHIFAGQYFDRPNPQGLAKQGIGAPRMEEDGRTAAMSTFVVPSILYTWNLFRVRILFPLLKYRELLHGSKSALQDKAQSKRSSEDSTSSSSHQPHSQTKRLRGGDRDGTTSAASGHQRFPPMWNKLFLSWNKMYSSLGPFLQMSVPAFTLIYYTWSLPFAKYLMPVNARTRFGDVMGDKDMKIFGAFQNNERPPWSEVFFVTSMPIFAPLLFFSRLINPIPDLVAGSNVLKAVRNEAKNYGGITSKSSKSKVQKEIHEAHWSEQNRSVVAQNRLRLIVTVALLRILENIYVANILPWTSYACRATGHCNEGIQLWQLSTVLFPAGITTTLRTDGSTSNDFNSDPDYLASFVAGCSVIIVSGVLLLAQAVTLNGSYLAITGYICGEWTMVDPEKDLSAKSASVNPSLWDPKRRYKKGDVIVVNRAFWFPRQVFYKATSNSPEGRPFDLFLRATHMFRNELGHPSTSKLLNLAIKGHLVFIAILIVLVLANALLKGNSSNGMLLALIANMVACYGAIYSGLQDRMELCRLSEEVRR